MTTAAQHLRTIARTWPDLHEALGTPAIHHGFGQGLRDYLAQLDALDAEEIEAQRHHAAALRQLERSPDQIGVRPVPIRLAVHDTMRLVTAALVECADRLAADIQRSPMTDAPRSWPAADRARRDQLAEEDRNNPQRWRFTGNRTAIDAALWLCARADGIPGPQRPLTDAEHKRIAITAAGAVERIERVLDTGARTAALAPPCPDCGGRLTAHGGAGAAPTAHCGGCGRTWASPASAA
ncbi:hypothetical protein [Streptomyces sp. NPDC001985]|uniref:hypothetical protein n=1 Tax=Streptomyces sp. NPDC001985 TaxID=3154406 RepID=UPI0033331CAC